MFWWEDRICKHKPFPVWPVVGPLEDVTSSRSCQEKKKLDVSLLEYPQRPFWKSQSPGSAGCTV